MRRVFLATTCMIALAAQPALAQRGGFAAGLAGGLIGGAIAGAIVAPRAPVYAAPPPVYVAPPTVIYQPRPVYAPPPPVYVAPAARVSFHPWPGPAFACYDPEPNAVNRAICASEELSAASLAVQQAFYAAMQQTPYNAGQLRAEYASFVQNQRVSCSAFSYQQQNDCIGSMLGRQRDQIVGRLNGVFADEAARPVATHVAVQQRLRAMGLLPGTADGIYGDSTRRAIVAWQSGQRRSATGVLTDEEVGMLIPGYGAPPPPMQVMAPPPVVPAPQQPAPIQPATVTASVAVPVQTPPPAPVAAAAPTDIVGGVREGMPYGQARAKLFTAGWQTQYFSNAALSDQDRDSRQWFIDHRYNEVQDCSSSGCKLQFHNSDGRMLYVYTQVGSRASDAYRGAGPSVIAYCIDVDDIACSAPQAASGSVTQQATK